MQFLIILYFVILKVPNVSVYRLNSNSLHDIFVQLLIIFYFVILKVPNVSVYQILQLITVNFPSFCLPTYLKKRTKTQLVLFVLLYDAANSKSYYFSFLSVSRALPTFLKIYIFCQIFMNFLFISPI